MLVLFSLAPAARFPQGIYPLHEAVDALNVAVVNLLISVPKYAVYVAAENKVLNQIACFRARCRVSWYVTA